MAPPSVLHTVECYTVVWVYVIERLIHLRPFPRRLAHGLTVPLFQPGNFPKLPTPKRSPQRHLPPSHDGR